MLSMRSITRSLVTALVLAILMGASLPAGTQAQMGMDMGTAGSHGIVCTTNPSATFTLTATDGYIQVTDGNVIYMWGYALGGGAFQYPGPVLCVNEGDTVTVVLHNDLPEDVSIVFPGQTGVLADGAASQPVFDGGNLVSLTKTAPPGGSVTYSFVAGQPGTYLYESGTDPVWQVQMGLAGALIVRPALDTMDEHYAYNDAETRYNPDTEFLMFLSQIDPHMHMAAERGEPFDMTYYHPRYWLINGRSFPDTLAANNVARLPHQPYGALARIHPYDPDSNPLPSLVRYLSAGMIDYPMHPHGNHGRVIARDGHLLKGPAGEDLSYEKFTVVVGPGQTADALFTWHDAEGWDPETNPIPVTIPPIQDMVLGMYYSGSPYLGEMVPMPPGMAMMNQCGEYYIISHNHALQQIVAWDLPMSGMATYIRIDPPQPNMCP